MGTQGARAGVGPTMGLGGQRLGSEAVWGQQDLGNLSEGLPGGRGVYPAGEGRTGNRAEWARPARGTAAVPQAAAPAQDSVKPRMAGREAAAWMGASGVTHVAVLCGRTGGRGRRRRKEAAWEKHASSPAAEAAALPGCPGPGSTLPSSPWSRHGQIRLARPPAFCFDLALISGNRELTVEPPLRPEPGSDRPCLGQSPALL